MKHSIYVEMIRDDRWRVAVSVQTPENLISFFSQAGEVKYVRMAGESNGVARSAYLELTDQRSVATCLGYNGVNFNGRTIT